MGSVLTPLTIGLREAVDLPNACTLNGRCAEVCPVRIPLPDLLRTLRHRQFQHQIGTRRAHWALALWGWLVRRPGLYHGVTRLQARALSWMAGKDGRLKAMPLAGNWFKGGRVLPAPEGETFMSAWRRRGKQS
jgi:L-lactate dehydrogenase complex protein LldF